MERRTTTDDLNIHTALDSVSYPASFATPSTTSDSSTALNKTNVYEPNARLQNLDTARLQATELYERLLDPPAEYRAIPFWSWNDRLEPEEIRRQVREMKQAGLGGFIMHARAGLETPYMGAEWMDCIAAGIDEGHKLGMRVWCYDENGWPSGFADGVVPALGLDYQQKWLKLERLNPTEAKTAAYEALRHTEQQGERVSTGDNSTDNNDQEQSNQQHSKQQHDKQAASTEENSNQENNTQENSNSEAKRTIASYRFHQGRYIRLAEDELHLAELRLYYDVNPYYIDTLDAQVVHAFIESTYERYAERFAAHFGQAIAGIFTDEPQYGRNQVPWSFTLQQRYTEAYSTDMLDDLPLLFVEGAGYEQVRYRFWQLVTRLFAQSFMGQIGDWCQRHHIRLTGHVVSEDHLTAQTGAVGDAMASYEYMQVPGIDWLGRFIDNPLTPKQVSSVAHQLGKKFVLSETFGCSGWNVSFADLKWIAEWQYVHGINLMCQHLQGYSLRGIRKRDYPPSLYYQQPWWSQYERFNDYFGRLSMLMAESTVEADILLLHPIRSSWLVYTHPVEGADETIALDTKLGLERGERINQDFVQVSEWLGALHYEHDYGSESIIERHGRIEGKRLIVGQAAYGTVILPPMLTISSSTLELLLRFSEQGGRILALGTLPDRIDGRQDTRLRELELRTPCLPLELSALQHYLEQHVPSVLTLLHVQRLSDYRQMERAEEKLVELDPVTDSPLLSRIQLVQSGNVGKIASRAMKPNESSLSTAIPLHAQPDRLVYIVNTDREHGYRAQFELRLPGQSAHCDASSNHATVRLDHIDLEHGMIQPLPVYANYSNGCLRFRVELDFAPAQSYMLRVSDTAYVMPTTDTDLTPQAATDRSVTAQSPQIAPSEAKLLAAELAQSDKMITSTVSQSTDRITSRFGVNNTETAPQASVTMSAYDWQIELSDLNSITLDRCRWRIAGEQWSAPEPIILVQQHLLKLGHAVDVELEFTVDAAAGGYLQQQLFLVLEQPQRYQISINGQALQQQELGWWRDIAFRRLDVSGWLHEGTNRIVLAGHFANSEATYAAAARAEAFESEGNKLFYDTELESMYILGHFAVQSVEDYTFDGYDAIYTNGSFRLMEPQQTVRTGDLTTQGLLFYAGNVRLHRSLIVDELQSGERVWLVCERPHAVLARVLVNGHDCATWMWAPYEADITDWLQYGDNELTIELLSSCRNLLGPHHHIRGELTMVGPDSFTDQPSWTDGNFDGDSIYVDRYCMVRFGLASEPRLIIRSEQ
ncbi:glycosyl hydrolase [Paenibacillus sp. SGZ-1009]|uniref:glycosyl hydrolase n=1 Tax=Paenibacillus campi TaxID=3106031 RepID=UPI002AFEC2A5|nr:glycosyl hydrolase [Paenibacillus sp. SGZ-1009]